MTESTACATGCGRPAPGTTLCRDCVSDLRRTLELAASIEPDLLDAIAKQLRHGARGKSASAEAPLPYDPMASAAAGALRVALSAACTHTFDRGGSGWILGTITVMAKWLIADMAKLAASRFAGQHYHEIRDGVARCVRVLEPPPELHPAGPCSACGRQLMAEPGADTAMCGCGMLNAGLIAMRAQRAAAADVLGDSEAISRALGNLGIRVSGGTIRMWVTRKRLIPRTGGQLAMSDVLALVAERDNRKIGA